MSIIGFDIETTHLKGNMGHILVAVAQPLGGKAKVWRIDKTPGFGKSPQSFVNDMQIVHDIVDYLSNEAEIVITHYGTYFDLPFVNTRALTWGLKPLPPLHHIDMWKISRKQLALTSNRQATINDLITAEHQKYKPGWEVWRRAQYGDKKALTVLTEYCKNDVGGLLDNYVALRPLIYHHPIMMRAKADACPACGSAETQRRGHRRTKRQRIERIQCQSCGTWFDGAKENIK